MSQLSLDGIVKRYGDLTALDGMSIDVEPGEFHCLFGPSASGKTTTLRVIAGLERVAAGTVVFEDEALGFQALMVLFAVIATLLLWVSYRATKEVVQPKQEHISLRDSLRAIAKHLLIYALGRGTTDGDEPALEHLTKALEEEPTLEHLIREIVTLDAFRKRSVVEERADKRSTSKKKDAK